MSVREARTGRKTAKAAPREQPPALLEGTDPIAVAVGSLYAYDMVLSIEAGVKGPQELISWYRGKMEEKYSSETDRKTALGATVSELRKLAAGNDDLQKAAAGQLLALLERKD